MLQLNIGVLQAMQTKSIIVRNAFQCTAQCLSQPDCFYLTRNAGGTSCTLYTSGPTTYNVSELLTYVVKYKAI